jgi:hypothetical protein
MRVGTRAVIDTSGIRALASEAQTRSITLKAVRAGIKVLLPVAKAGAPRRQGSGALKQSQGTKAVKGRRGKTGSYAVQGAKTKTQKVVKGKIVKPGKYDHLVQGGTKPHMAGKRKHPGAKPNPYRKRAYEGLKSEIGSMVASVMAVEVQKTISKNAAKLLAKLRR